MGFVVAPSFVGTFDNVDERPAGAPDLGIVNDAYDGNERAGFDDCGGGAIVLPFNALILGRFGRDPPPKLGKL